MFVIQGHKCGNPRLSPFHAHIRSYLYISKYTYTRPTWDLLNCGGVSSRYVCALGLCKYRTGNKMRSTSDLGRHTVRLRPQQTGLDNINCSNEKAQDGL
eukprot:1177500-Prorocentrum_minimum.AAC.2